ncbi:hypothetical protein Tco_0788429, partial [Tanacetum coccineum]
EPPGSFPFNYNVLPTLVHQFLHPCLLARQIALLEVEHLSQLVYTETSFPYDTSHIHNVSLVVCSGTAGEFSVAGTTGVVTIVGVTVIAIVHIILLQALVNDPLNQLHYVIYAFDSLVEVTIRVGHDEMILKNLELNND